jgi:hypothetical protein
MLFIHKYVLQLQYNIAKNIVHGKWMLMGFRNEQTQLAPTIDNSDDTHSFLRVGFIAQNSSTKRRIWRRSFVTRWMCFGWNSAWPPVAGCKRIVHALSNLQKP